LHRKVCGFGFAAKTKLIFFSSESTMAEFYVRAKVLNISIENIPISIYSSGIHCDFSNFLGWGLPSIGSLSELSVNQVEGDVRKWVESPSEKIDIWEAEITVAEEVPLARFREAGFTSSTKTPGNWNN
jgi:hypothetical protein